MNDIENLIARSTRPSPSPELDARIAALVRRPVIREASRSPLRRFSVLVVSTACAGIIGFVAGKHSVTPVKESQTAVAVHAALTDAPSTPATNRTVVTIDEPQNEALARYVMPTKRLEGLFGNGPLEEHTGPSQLE